MRAIALILAAAWSTVASADETGPSAATLLTSLSGSWSGQLQYRDYQSNALEEIGLTIEFSTTPDAATLIERAVFQDPGFKVYTVTVSTVGPQGDRQVAFFRDREMQTYTQQMRVLATAGTGRDWTIRLERTGEDNDVPARIRETVSRAGNTLTWEKQVDLLEDDTIGFEFRNRITLVRLSGD